MFQSPWRYRVKCCLIGPLSVSVTWWRHKMGTCRRYWPFVRGIYRYRSPVDSPHTGQWRGALMLSLICVWITVGWVNVETLSRSSWRHSNECSPPGSYDALPANNVLFPCSVCKFTEFGQLLRQHSSDDDMEAGGRNPRLHQGVKMMC